MYNNDFSLKGISHQNQGLASSFLVFSVTFCEIKRKSFGSICGQTPLMQTKALFEQISLIPPEFELRLSLIHDTIINTAIFI